jgi:hypothetical protein
LNGYSFDSLPFSLKLRSFDEFVSADWNLFLQMLDYNVRGGKLNRGLSVVDSYKLLKQGQDLTEKETFLSCALGWCIEWVIPLLLLFLSFISMLILYLLAFAASSLFPCA